MKKTFWLFNNHVKFEIPRDLSCLEKISKRIQNELIQNSQYIVVSRVRNEIFQIFVDYWVENTEPLLDSDNIYELNLLMNEFDLESKNILYDHEDLLQISILKCAFSSLHDISDSEKYIAQHLDFYIKKFKKQIKCIPITSLYNIFYHKERILNDQNLAYSFITNNNVNDSGSIYIILGSLDANKLKLENVQDSIFNRDKHFGFSIQNESLYIKNGENQIQMKNITINNFERQNDLQQQEISRLQKQIVNLGQQKDELINNQKMQQQKINELQDQMQQQNQKKKSLEDQIQMQQQSENNFKIQVQLQNQRNKDIIQQLNDEIARKDEIIAGKDNEINDKNQEISQKQQTINNQLRQINIKEIQLSNTIDMRVKKFFRTFCNAMKTSFLRFQAFLFSKRFLIYILIAFLFSLFIVFIIFNKQILRQYYKYYASKDHVDSIFMYAKYLYNGIGGPEEKEESKKLYKKAADEGCIDAMIAYASILKNEMPRKQREINKYYKMAADKGCAKAMRYYAQSTYNIDIKESVKYFKMAADKNDVESMHEYAEIILKRMFSGKNIKEAIEYYKRAAFRGHEKSIFTLAEMYYNGSFGLEKNYVIAFSYYKKASEMNNAKAANMCAQMLYYGKGTEKNNGLSFKYFKKAEKLGYKKQDSEYIELINEFRLKIFFSCLFVLSFICNWAFDNKH